MLYSANLRDFTKVLQISVLRCVVSSIQSHAAVLSLWFPISPLTEFGQGEKLIPEVP